MRMKVNTDLSWAGSWLHLVASFPKDATVVYAVCWLGITLTMA